MQLELQANPEYIDDASVTDIPGLLVCPTDKIGDDDYWTFKIDVGGGQSVIAFPKFLILGVGFFLEEDWNTNLPYSCGCEEIWNHIKHNKGPATVSDEDCKRAIQMIIDVCTIYNGD